MAKETDIMFYNDCHEGQLVYVTEDGRGVIEQTETDADGEKVKQGEMRFVVKLYFTEFEKWNKLATELLADVKEMQRWSLAKDGWKDMNVKTAFVDRNYETEKYAATDNDLLDYRLLQAWKRSTEGWRIYENDVEYLFVWKGTVRNYDDFGDKLVDSAWKPIRFLRAWYDRVNGIASEDD